MLRWIHIWNKPLDVVIRAVAKGIQGHICLDILNVQRNAIKVGPTKNWIKYLYSTNTSIQVQDEP